MTGGDGQGAAEAASESTLNSLLALGAGPRRELRKQLSQLLTIGSPARSKIEALLYDTEQCDLHLPTTIGDYTDFYVGIHHANNIGKQFRPDNPLLPNYKHIPIGYHGRASSVRPSGSPVRRPNGQTKLPTADSPLFGPCGNLHPPDGGELLGVDGKGMLIDCRIEPAPLRVGGSRAAL
jgi:fumarylacetoacetase